MRLLYETDNHDNCTEVESRLINYSIAIHGNKNKNEIGGGGGRKPEASRLYVYAAYRCKSYQLDVQLTVVTSDVHTLLGWVQTVLFYGECILRA